MPFDTELSLEQQFALAQMLAEVNACNDLPALRQLIMESAELLMRRQNVIRSLLKNK